MLQYAARRLLASIPTLLVTLTIVFFLVRAVPGGPAMAMLGDYATPDAVRELDAKLGLDQPLLTQYGRYVSDLLRGDLGRSMINGMPIAPQVARALPHTLLLTLAAIVIGVVLGLPLGVVTALRRNTAWDYVMRVGSLAGISIPAFYLGIVLMLGLSVKLDLFPVTGAGDLSDPLDTLRHLALPALTLGLSLAAFVTRTARSALLNVLREDYIRTARAKGLRECLVVFGHALGNALIPVVALIGVYSIVLIGSSVLVEIVFSRPGLGKMMIGGIMQRDYIAVQSVMAVYAVIVTLLNLSTDLAYGLVDPRVRYDR